MQLQYVVSCFMNHVAVRVRVAEWAGGLVASSSVLVLCGGVPVGTSSATTSRGLVQEHKRWPDPSRGGKPGGTLRLRESIDLFHHPVASANIRRNNSQEEVESGKEELGGNKDVVRRNGLPVASAVRPHKPRGLVLTPATG